MSSFFSSSSSYKPQAQIRQEGFHPDNTASNTNSNGASSFDLFNPFLPDPFRKFPSAPSPSMDFSDELASLIQGPTSHDRSQPAQQDERYHRPPHNIFDISAPTPANESHHSPSSYPTHFAQTLPALNSSLRYENPESTTAPPPPPPPSSFHPFTRHTPSPNNGPNANGHSRSRSRSRPPSAGAGAGGVGPARTTRSRRNNSVSGTSPPPGRPHAIVIPRSRAATVSGNANGAQAGWYMPGHSASEFSLPTPDSLTSHHSLSHSHSHAHHAPPGGPNPYSPFSLSPPPPESALHLPPVSALHTLHQHQQQQQQSYLHHGSPHSLPTLHTSLPPNTSVESPKSPHAHVPSNASVEPPPVQAKSDKQALLANEKRRRRRESHNAVERRRRDNINEKISELATLIPECLLDVGAPNAPTHPNAASPGTGDDAASPLEWKKEGGSDGTPPPASANASSLPNAASALPNANGAANGNGTAAEGLGIVKANKGMILRKSVEYIRYLQQLVEAQGARNRELERELGRWRGRSPSDTSDPGMSGANPPTMEMLYANGYAAANGGANGGQYFGLPSMPEGGEDGEEGDEGGDEEMDVESPPSASGEDGDAKVGRGRTRGVNGVGGGKVGKAPGKGGRKGLVKEEGGAVEEMMVL
ncbi:hypothetical protein DXG01_015987 [Tephrocybe rancida]|nr:hypothetical protein DXG01_015987 [Tephrocybe rancida]